MSVRMRVLIVEDDEGIIEHLRELFESSDIRAEVVVVNSRDTAISEISNADSFFDLLSLDLTIPPTNGSHDLDSQNGHAVLGQCRALAPGLPIFILTGMGSDDFVATYLRESHTLDIWGEGQRRPTIDHLSKQNLDELSEKIRKIAVAINGLDEIEIAKKSITGDLSIKADRLIRIFVKHRHGTRCEVSRITEGLSDTDVFALSVFDESGARVIKAVAKIGSHKIIGEEVQNHNDYILRLDPDATPRHIETVEFGAKDIAGVFYSLAEGFDDNFFRLAAERNVSDALKKSIPELTERWKEGVGERRLPIAQIRRAILSDQEADSLAETYNIDWKNEFERRIVQVKWCCTHGDFHGGNLLVNRRLQKSTMIDFGEVAIGPSSLDPITLEFSSLFHPGGPDLAGWPTSEQARRWFDFDFYLKGCPIPEAVTFCRCWANNEAVGPREIAATAYAYFFMQLKHEGTNKELAIALLEGARIFLERN